MTELDAPLLQFGALGILGFVVWWLTMKLNGKMDRLSDSIEKLTDTIQDRLPRVR